MSKRHVACLCALLDGVIGTRALADYTTVMPPIAAEDSHAEILASRYGGTFSLMQGSTRNFSNGVGVTAIRVPDRLPASMGGGPGAPIFVGDAATLTSEQETDQIWIQGFDQPKWAARFASYRQEFGFLEGAGGASLGGEEDYGALFQLTQNPTAHYFNDTDFDPIQLLPPQIPFMMPLRWTRAGGPQTRRPFGLPDRLFSSREGDAVNPDPSDHMVTYRIYNEAKPTDVTWMLFWEDLLPNQPSDFDFNDLVVEVRVVARRWIGPASGNWSDPSKWGRGAIPDGVGAVANFFEDITQPSTVTLDTNRTATSVRFVSPRSYTISGLGTGSTATTLTLASASRSAPREVLVEQGNHVIAANVRILVDESDEQDPGTLNLRVNGLTDSLKFTRDFIVDNARTLDINKRGFGLVEVPNLASVANGPLTLKIEKGTFRLAAGAISSAASKVNKLDIVTPDDAKLDISNHAFVIDYGGSYPDDPFNAIKSYIVSGYHGGDWGGPGITSSLVNGRYGVGYARRAALGSLPPIFIGADNDSVLFRYTRYGDADLNGVVNLVDFNALAANFNQNNRVWTQGDFNYDGLVNLVDFNRLAGNFNLIATGADGPTPADWAELAAAVPEPVGSPLVLGAWPLLHRRRRHA